MAAAFQGSISRYEQFIKSRPPAAHAPSRGAYATAAAAAAQARSYTPPPEPTDTMAAVFGQPPPLTPRGADPWGAPLGEGPPEFVVPLLKLGKLHPGQEREVRERGRESHTQWLRGVWLLRCTRGAPRAVCSAPACLAWFALRVPGRARRAIASSELTLALVGRSQVSITRKHADPREPAVLKLDLPSGGAAPDMKLRLQAEPLAAGRRPIQSIAFAPFPYTDDQARACVCIGRSCTPGAAGSGWRAPLRVECGEGAVRLASSRARPARPAWRPPAARPLTSRSPAVTATHSCTHRHVTRWEWLPPSPPPPAPHIHEACPRKCEQHS